MPEGSQRIGVIVGVWAMGKPVCDPFRIDASIDENRGCRSFLAQPTAAVSMMASPSLEFGHLIEVALRAEGGRGRDARRSTRLRRCKAAGGSARGARASRPRVRAVSPIHRELLRSLAPGVIESSIVFACHRWHGRRVPSRS